MAAFLSVLFPRHTNAAARDNTINLIHTFRDYLHYHIKCSKVPRGCSWGGKGRFELWLAERFKIENLSREDRILKRPRVVSAGLYSHAHEGKNIGFPQGAEPCPSRRREERNENNHVSGKRGQRGCCGQLGTGADSSCLWPAAQRG